MEGFAFVLFCFARLLLHDWHIWRMRDDDDC